MKRERVRAMLEEGVKRDLERMVRCCVCGHRTMAMNMIQCPNCCGFSCAECDAVAARLEPEAPEKDEDYVQPDMSYVVCMCPKSIGRQMVAIAVRARLN